MRWVVLFAVACGSGGPRRDDKPAPLDVPRSTEPGPKVALETGSGEAIVTVEVVVSPPLLQKGLMYRDHLAPDGGMLFFMNYEADHEFYMRNTLIPLDMIFITKDFTVAGIVENATPRTEDHRHCGKPSWYVLEVNGGWTAAHHLAAGAKVRFDGVTGKDQ